MIVPGRFSGRVAVVTGAASGIGYASAARLAREGASVALIDIDEQALLRATDGLREDGCDVRAWPGDVSKEDDLAEAVAGIIAAFGQVDILHANAGIVLAGRLEDESLERWQQTLAVNVTGIFLSCRLVIPQMQRQGKGAIVTTGSISGLVAEPALAAYCTSKAAVNHMTRQIALDQAARGIRANAVCPGWVDTPFNEPFLRDMTPEEIDAAVRATVPLARQAAPDEIAAAVAFLASDDASYITGHCLVVDGGYTLA